MSNELDAIQPVATRMRGFDIVSLEQSIARWKMELGSRRIDTSIALNAAALLIIRGDNEELVREHAAKQGKSDEEAEQLVKIYSWFMREYFGMLSDVITTRNQRDGRRTKNVA